MTPEDLAERARSDDADVRQEAAVTLAEEVSNLPLMFEMMGDSDWRVRKTIVDGLVRRANDRIIEGFIGALRDGSNAGRRNSATEALIRIGSRGGPKIIATLAEESDPDVRLSLVNLLGDLRSDEAFDELVRLASEEQDVNIVSGIATAIGRYQRPEAVPILTGMLKREDPWVQFHLIEALGEIEDRNALPHILPLYSKQALRKPILEAVGRIADVGTINFLLRIISEESKLNLTALRSLVAIADADKPRVMKAAEREMIQRRLEQSFPADKVEPLIGHLRSTPKREVKAFILRVLAWSGDVRAVPVLIEMMREAELAEVAASGLIDIGPSAAEAVLIELKNTLDADQTILLLRIAARVARDRLLPAVLPSLEHPSPDVRRTAVEVLTERADPKAIDYLIARLDDEDVGVQQAVVNALSELAASAPAAKPAMLGKLRKLLDSRSLAERLNSLHVFVNIEGEGFPDELLAASRNRDPQIREKAVSLMGRFHEERFADQLVLLLTDEATPVRLAAIRSIVRMRPEGGLAPLVSSLGDPEIWIRTAAAQALGEYHAVEAVAPLIERLRSDIPPVKIAVLEALGKLDHPDSHAALASAVDSEDPEVQRAALLSLARVPGEKVTRILLDCLESEDWRHRAAAASALGHRESQEATGRLEQLLASDPDPYVRQTVVQALDRIGRPESFPALIQALDDPAIVDEVSDAFVRHGERWRESLEEAWRTADARREPVIAAILAAMKNAKGQEKAADASSP